MRSVCFFASYFTTDKLPYYIRVYLLELKKHFTDIILISTRKNLDPESLDFLRDNGVTMLLEKNEGYDFGLWYKALIKTDIAGYESVALVNDSCVLFSSLGGFFSWASAQNAEVLGMTYSEAIAPHLQSYFLLFRKKAVPAIKQYFIDKGLRSDIKEVIEVYEVGMSTYLVNKGFSLASFMSPSDALSEYSPSYSQVENHLKSGIPLIKKKILQGSFRKDELFTMARLNFNINPRRYYQLMSKQNLILDLKKLKNDLPFKMNGLQTLRFNLLKFAIRLLRPVNNLFSSIKG